MQISSSSIRKRFTIGYTDARGVAPERAGADQAIGGAPVAAEDAPVAAEHRVSIDAFSVVFSPGVTWAFKLLVDIEPFGHGE